MLLLRQREARDPVAPVGPEAPLFSVLLDGRDDVCDPRFGRAQFIELSNYLLANFQGLVLGCLPELQEIP